MNELAAFTLIHSFNERAGRLEGKMERGRFCELARRVKHLWKVSSSSIVFVNLCLNVQKDFHVNVTLNVEPSINSFRCCIKVHVQLTG